MFNIAFVAVSTDEFTKHIDEFWRSMGILLSSKNGMKLRIEMGKMATNYVASNYNGRFGCITAYSF